MSTGTVVRAVPRAFLSTSIKAARLPVDVASRITGRPEEWPPTLAADLLEAKIDTLVGSLMMDAELLDRARLLKLKVDELRKAATLHAVAEREREEADAQLENQREEAQRQREQAEQRAQEREAEATRRAQARKQEVEQTTAAKKAAVRQTRAAQEKAISRQQQRGAHESLAKEAEALSKAKEAVRAEEKAALVEDAIEGSKEARKLP